MGKARFDTALDAERTCDWRYRAYQCPICHGYHLTSRAGNAMTEPEPSAPPAKKEPGPQLGDLDWSAALDPQPKPARPPKAKRPQRPPPPPEPPTRLARCIGPVGKDGKAPLVIEGRLVKSAVIKDRSLRASLAAGKMVRVGVEEPPVVLRLD